MKLETVSMNEVERQAKGHWFSNSTMNFFNSKTYEPAYKIDEIFYFISSERHNAEKRFYSIRKMSEGRIGTIGEFQGYSSLNAATKSLKALVDELKGTK